MLVALDAPTLDNALTLAAALKPLVGGFKVGLELCTAAGVPRVVEAVAAAGGPVFLDLKLHDIPNTVAGAVRAVCALGPTARFLTIHTQGGAAMLRAAAEAAASAAQRPLLLGITLLTSIGPDALRDELGVPTPLEQQVLQLARLAQAAGLDGVVASPYEAAAIRRACGPNFLIVTPGVRPAWAEAGDQQRVLTPAEALAAGADFLVLGRPITAAADPAVAAARIAAELQER
jgi:orotidine-5'-phosphate decarboxylase